MLQRPPLCRVGVPQPADTDRQPDGLRLGALPRLEDDEPPVQEVQLLGLQAAHPRARHHRRAVRPEREAGPHLPPQVRCGERPLLHAGHPLRGQRRAPAAPRLSGDHRHRGGRRR